ncbi:uncharacterized protein PRCAT00004975001 [Priceomyces carsonii]|uniref:uncharacterized protein n=1 Tax=Priceomyces carsonii TaxID=28549 RepID=UPI002ED9D206|nr:unnamed protein product [Priceomyces carsonii]
MQIKLFDVVAVIITLCLSGLVAAPASITSISNLKLDKRNNLTPLGLGSYSTSIASVSTKEPIVAPTDLVDDMFDTLINLYWDETQANFNDNCGGSYSEPVIWNVAVAGLAASRKGNETVNRKVYEALQKYKNHDLGGYSATTAGNNDIYEDDDSQVSWVFINNYKVDEEEDYIDSAVKLINFISDQKGPNGGIEFSYQGNYIASISTLEAALAAVRLNEEKSNSTLISFAVEQLDWIFDHLLDSNDHLIYDGCDKKGNVNNGKLTYTIGVAISTMAILVKHGNTKRDWQAIATEFGVRTFGAGNSNSLYYTNGHLNNGVQYTHDLFNGITDLLELTIPLSNYQRQAYDMFKAELVREARHYYDVNTVDITSGNCGSNITNLLDLGSYIQIFEAVGRITDKI